MYKVKWKYTNCSGTFGKTFDQYEDAAVFAQVWLMNAVFASDGDCSAFDYKIINFTKTGEKNHV
ncbi:MAG: hypothetical protein VW879_05475 [Opitutae bacterium]|jgi:hypothetical protein